MSGLEALVLGIAFSFYFACRSILGNDGCTLILGTPVTLYNFTVMGDKVLTLSLGKEAFSDYKEGEYAYIYCPHVSWLWKHPFTICSAPSRAQYSSAFVSAEKQLDEKGTRLFTKIQHKRGVVL